MTPTAQSFSINLSKLENPIVPYLNSAFDASWIGRGLLSSWEIRISNWTERQMIFVLEQEQFSMFSPPKNSLARGSGQIKPTQVWTITNVTKVTNVTHQRPILVRRFPLKASAELALSAVLSRPPPISPDPGQSQYTTTAKLCRQETWKQQIRYFVSVSKKRRNDNPF